MSGSVLPTKALSCENFLAILTHSPVGFFDSKYSVGKVYIWWVDLFESFNRTRDDTGLSYELGYADSNTAFPNSGFKYKIVSV
jgi:hypothetical protein